MDFEKLYNTYYMEVYSYIMTIVKSSHLAEELTQEVFFKILKTKKPFEHKSSEFTWLCAIAKNACYDALKSKSRTQELTEDIPHETNLSKALIEEEEALTIHKILHTIEEPYKEVFQLRIFGELSFAKIGAIFGKSENWARVTYHRARLKMIVSLLCGIFATIVNDVLNWIIDGTKYFSLFDCNFSNWNKTTINPNVNLIILIICTILGIALIAIGVVCKKKQQHNYTK